MVAGAVAERVGVDVGKKRTSGQPAPKVKTYSVRLSAEVSARVEQTATTLGLDEANFLRSLVVQNLPAYEKKAERVRSGLPPE
jgi:hypothetical protein